MPASDHASFATTRWSLIASLGDESTDEARTALGTLCETYWYPLYAYVRRKGHQPAEAQDLTQAFFSELLEKRRLRLADQQRGRFRAFLLVSFNHFLANHWRDAQAQKRGGGTQTLPFNVAVGEERYQLEPAHELTAERIFERRWALTLLERTVERVRNDYARSSKLRLFDQLKGHLGYGDAIPYQEIARSLHMSETAVKVAAHRLRKRIGEVLRAEIAETVEGPDRVDEELRELFAALEP